MKNPFKYTTAALNLVFEDIKKIATITRFASSSITVFYLTFMIIRGLGNLIANIILLSLLVLYLIFDFLTTFVEKLKSKEVRRMGKRVYRILKLFVKTGVLAVNLYGLYLTTTTPSVTTLVSTVLSIVLWTISVVLEITIYIIDRRFLLLKESFSKDIETFTEPVTNVVNVVKKFKGEEPIKPKERSKRFLIFKRKVDKKAEEKEAKADAIEESHEQPKKKKKIFLIGKRK